MKKLLGACLAAIFLGVLGSCSGSDNPAAISLNRFDGDPTLGAIIQKQFQENSYNCDGSDSTYFAMGSVLPGSTQAYVFEVRNLGMSVYKEELTEADRLNGFDIGASVAFDEDTVYRMQEIQDRKWGDWRSAKGAVVDQNGVIKGGWHKIHRRNGEWSYRSENALRPWLLLRGLFDGAKIEDSRKGFCPFSIALDNIDRSPFINACTKNGESKELCECRGEFFALNYATRTHLLDATIKLTRAGGDMNLASKLANGMSTEDARLFGNNFEFSQTICTHLR